MRGILLYISFWILGTSLHGQDLKADVRAMGNYMQLVPSLKSGISMSVFYRHDKKKPQIQNNLLWCKNGHSYYYRLADRELFLNENALIMTELPQKTLFYTKANKKELDALIKQLYGTAADTLVQHYDSVQFKGVEEGRKHYTIYTSKKDIQKTELYLDAKTLLLSHLVYYYHPKRFQELDKVEVHYENSQPSDEEVHRYLEEQSFLTVGPKKKLTPSAHYKGYKTHWIESEK